MHVCGPPLSCRLADLILLWLTFIECPSLNILGSEEDFEEHPALVQSGQLPKPLADSHLQLAPYFDFCHARVGKEGKA